MLCPQNDAVCLREPRVRDPGLPVSLYRGIGPACGVKDAQAITTAYSRGDDVLRDRMLNFRG